MQVVSYDTPCIYTRVSWLLVRYRTYCSNNRWSRVFLLIFECLHIFNEDNTIYPKVFTAVAPLRAERVFCDLMQITYSRWRQNVSVDQQQISLHGRKFFSSRSKPSYNCR